MYTTLLLSIRFVIDLCANRADLYGEIKGRFSAEELLRIGRRTFDISLKHINDGLPQRQKFKSNSSKLSPSFGLAKPQSLHFSSTTSSSFVDASLLAKHSVIVDGVANSSFVVALYMFLNFKTSKLYLDYFEILHGKEFCICFNGRFIIFKGKP